MNNLHSNVDKTQSEAAQLSTKRKPFDELLYCEKCCEFVYQYCSLHGPLLTIPDDKVSKRSLPSMVPRAALSIPSEFLHLNHSKIPGAGLGVFSSVTLPRGVRFGPYRGRKTNEIRSMYCWQIYDRNNKPSHVVDAADANGSNWMRYVNCARHWCEQNLLAYQYQGQLYYRTIKTIRPFTELLVFYGTEYATSLNIDIWSYNFKHYYNIIGTSLPETENKVFEDNPVDYEDYSMSNTFNNKPSEDSNINICDTISEKDKNKTKSNINLSEYNSTDSLSNSKSITKTWQCHFCNRILSRKTRRKSHYSTHIIKFSCELCPYKTKIELDYNKHKDRHLQKDQFVCEICYFITNSRDNSNRHKRHMHKIKRDNCS